ncbi:hypothetical protein [Serinicoccus kebangsaanensis]|uniref:hypothetical protein n=1 Tax=Serinicoccus kebangsaanensis TaxID=2602069 RepID=UPI00124C954E|nr:hypothetical protein [Serinicoccus kebangsaanensis]
MSTDEQQQGSTDDSAVNPTTLEELKVAWTVRRDRLDRRSRVRLWRTLGRQEARELRPDGPIPLYRGCLPGDQRRMSWTESYWTARRYADRLGPEGIVYVAEAPPSALIGWPTADEVVVIPSRLRRIRRAKERQGGQSDQRATDRQSRRRGAARTWRADYEQGLADRHGSGETLASMVVGARRDANRGRPARRGDRPVSDALWRRRHAAAYEDAPPRPSRWEAAQQAAAAEVAAAEQTMVDADAAAQQRAAEVDAYFAGIEQRQQDRHAALAAEAAQWQAEHDEQRLEVKARRERERQALQQREAALAEQEVAQR